MKRITISLAAVYAGAVLAGCQSTPSTPVANGPANTNAATAAKPAEPAGDTKTATAAADTPTEAYKAAHAARKAGDVATLKKLMSRDILEFFEVLAEDGQTVDDVLKQLTTQPQAAAAEARNEKVTGDKATIEYLDENGKWKTMDLVREDGMWKLTLDTSKGELGVDTTDPKRKK